MHFPLLQLLHFVTPTSTLMKFYFVDLLELKKQHDTEYETEREELRKKEEELEMRKLHFEKQLEIETKSTYFHLIKHYSLSTMCHSFINRLS